MIPQKQILIVEDNEINREILKAILRRVNNDEEENYKYYAAVFNGGKYFERL